jgi:fatty-acyl-CoA synthase
LETYVDLILRNFAAFGEREAVVQGDVRISYAQAHDMVVRMAEVMRSRGVGPGDTVAMFTRNRAEAVLLQLATHHTGCRLVFVPPEPSIHELRAFMERAEVTCFIFDPTIELAVKLAEAYKPKMLFTLGPSDAGEDLLALCPQQSGTLDDPSEPSDISTLFYTGGTTGRPKMVLHKHSYYQALIIASGRRKAECPVPQRFLVCTLVNHTSGHISAILALMAEGTAILMDGFDAGEVIQTMHREHITSITVVPPMLYAILDHPSCPSTGFPDLVRLHYGGAPSTSSRIKQALDCFGPVLRQTYGLTEVPVVTLLESHEHDPSIPDRLSAVGKPMAGMGELAHVELRDDNGAVAQGDVGEVCIRGPLVMTEYWKDPEATARVIVDGWFHTGDLGRWDGDGFLHLVDRKKDVIITGFAHNVYSSLLEEVLTRHPGVLAAAAVGLPDDMVGETVHAVCVAAPGVPVDPAELGKMAAEVLGPDYEPKTITFVDALPWTAMGKIDKKALRARLVA